MYYWEPGRKAFPYCKVTENLIKLWSCFSVLWKVELENDEIEYSAVIYKPSVEGVIWFLLILMVK